MATDSSEVWGGNIASSISGLGIEAGTPVTPEQLSQLWEIVKTEDKSQLAKSAVAPGSFTASAGGGAVTGVGGGIT